MDWLRNNRWQLVVMGLVQGVIFSFLWRTFDLEGDVAAWIRIASGLLLAIPVLTYATENVPGLAARSRVIIIAAVSLLAIALQEYGFHVFDSTTWGSWFPQYVIPTLILMFISAHWLMHWRVLNPTHHAYEDLFHTTWRNAILCGLGVALTGVFWIVLTAGAELFKLIGINGLRDLIEKSWFAIPATTTVFALVVSLGLLREEMIVNLRKLLLGLLKWFLPLVLALATVWTLALPFKGLDTLFATRSAAWTMMATVALSILFANAAFQDGKHGTDYPRALGRALQWMWLALIPVAGIAVWAMSLRIGQYQWTSERAWGFFVALLAVGYAVGYSLSVFRRTSGNDWLPSVASTNRVMALVICVGIIALLSPLLSADRLEANSQAKRIMAMDVTQKGPESAEASSIAKINPDVGKSNLKQVPDVGFVARTGKFGVAAGRELERNIGKMKPETGKAVALLMPRQWEFIKANAAKPVKPVKGGRTLTIINPDKANAPLESWLRANLNKEKSVLNGCYSMMACRVFWLDLNNDGASEALLFDGQQEAMPSVYTWNGSAGQFVGTLNAKNTDGRDPQVLLPLLKSGEAETVDTPWKRVRAGGLEYGLE